MNVEKVSVDHLLNAPSIQRIITALGCGIGKNFDLNKLRYKKVIILTDADIDGLHIKSLILTLIYKYMQLLITNNYLYVAIPPLYRVIYNKSDSEYLQNDMMLQKWKNAHKNIKFEVQRFKGLGEMDPIQLQQTILNPKNRILKKITINDVIQAEKTLKVCMGLDTTLRKNFIEENAHLVQIDNI